MNIGIDASRYTHEYATGVEYYSRMIIDGVIREVLKKKNDKIVLYSRKQLTFSDDVKDLVKKNKGRITRKVLPAKRLWTLCALSNEMQTNPPDVLFVPSHVLPLTRPEKSVITIHDVAFRQLRGSYSFFQYHYLNWSTKYAVKHATKIIVPSEATAKDLKKFFKCPGGKIEVIEACILLHGRRQLGQMGQVQRAIFL